MTNTHHEWKAPPISSVESAAIPTGKKLEILMDAKGSDWYDGWKPYCLNCSTMARMHEENYGFRCGGCGNMIGFDLFRLTDSPLNKK